jgi:hypothetical protein
MGCRTWMLAAVVVSAAVTFGVGVWAGEAAGRREGLERLVAAYPSALSGFEGSDLIWRDGTRMPLMAAGSAAPLSAWLADPGILGMLDPAYPAGRGVSAPDLEQGSDQVSDPASNPGRGPVREPGRARDPAFFAKLYGDCTKGEVAASLVDVVWLPSKWGQTVKVSGRHGMAERLRAVSARLDALPARFDAFLFPPAGTYNCRPVAGEGRLSAHGYGIAFDLPVGGADYWRWVRWGKGGPPPWRNRIPAEIVAAFEAEGFVWGGRWRHFDTMHFEYRPEMFAR